MRTAGFVGAFLAASLVLAADGRGLSGHDDEREPPRVCTTETLQGNYGVVIRGTRPAAGFPPGTIEQVNGVGTQTFDGDGNFTQATAEKSSVTGMIARRTGFGTYSVDPGCTGTLTLTVPGVPFAIVSDFVIVNRGREFHTFVASPQASMIVTTAKRIE